MPPQQPHGLLEVAGVTAGAARPRCARPSTLGTTQARAWVSSSAHSRAAPSTSPHARGALAATERHASMAGLSQPWA
ncbi:MAG: hypothetical protein ABIQ18_35775, partial [Umezawaea sp.]